MTRRDHAVLTLTLEMVRGNYHETAIAKVLRFTPLLGIWTAWEAAVRRISLDRDALRRVRAYRLLRARLALALRTILREEEESYHYRAWWVDESREIHDVPMSRSAAERMALRQGTQAAPVVPLWLCAARSAPSKCIE